jgi:hypothetical protein
MAQRFTALIRIIPVLLAAVFALQVYRSAARPINTNEAYLYDRFVRPTTRQVLASELFDRDVFYSLLEKRSVGLFHVSPLSVRLPSLVFGIFYLWAVCQVARRWIWTVAFAALPLLWDCFARGNGTGTALALCACAVWVAIDRKYLNLIGICLGLSISANVVFAVPVVLLAVTILAIKRNWDDWCNRVLIPGAVVALMILVLPLSHAHASPPIPPQLTIKQSLDLQSALDALRTAGRGHVRIAAVSGAEPVVNFYRAQHRATNWDRAVVDDGSEQFDYYLLWAAEADSLQPRHLIEVHRDGEFVLARRDAAPM